MKEVVLLNYMQRTGKPIENEAEKTIKKALPRTLRSIQRAKKQKVPETAP